MLKKTLATIAIAILAIIAVPTGAMAAGYAPGTPSGSTVAAPGDTVTITWTGLRDAPINFTISGEGAPSLAAFKSGTSSMVKTPVNGIVAVDATLPVDARGTYTITGVYVGSTETIQPYTITVSTDAGGNGNGNGSDDGIASTGSDFPVLAVWAGAGVLLLGAALVTVMNIRRRAAHNN